MVSGTDIRPSAVSGSFYPEDKKELSSQLKSFLKNTKEKHPNSNIKALIVPHAGYIYSGQTAAWGYRQLPQNTRNGHFALIGPSHQYPFKGLVGSPSDFWQTPLGILKQIPAKDKNKHLVLDSKPHVSEHCLEVQLPFLQYLYPDQIGVSISCFLTGFNVDQKESAFYFLKYYPSAIFIISSDLSHYLPENIAREKDKKTIEAIVNYDSKYFFSEENAACGTGGILILMDMAKKESWKSELIYYDTSATAYGDKNAVVGYAAIGFYN
jgi:hypothetical protein